MSSGLPVPVRAARRPRVGLVAGGLGAYWPQFPGLLDALHRQTDRVRERLAALDADVIDGGFVSDAQEAAAAADLLAGGSCDLIVAFLATYLTATMLVPVAQRSGAPVLVCNLQPTESMDHASFGTGEWLAYCGACPLPEIGNTFERCGIPFRSVSGYMEDERAWARIATWVRAAGVRAALRHARIGLLGHLYPGMYDVATDLTMVPAHLGAHVEVLEIDDLRVRTMDVTQEQVTERLALARQVFDVAGSATETDLRWAAQVSVGLDRLVADFGLSGLAYYHRGLDGELHERLAAGFILGASLLTAQGIPACGEYELRTCLAMYMMQQIGAGGSFTELQALDFLRGHVEMGHDGPAHLGISAGRPLLRGLGVYHGKRGWGVSVEFDVRHGPVTALSVTQLRDGRWRMVTSEGTAVDGPHLQIGNTTSRIDFGCDPGVWCDAWSAARVAHHWALGTGHRSAELAAVADLLGLEFVQVRPAGR